ncbi:MAG: hypothetical protein R2697_00710 [Ilumatobacteraceae bacterium]
MGTTSHSHSRNATGGISPINRSRVMPPASPVTVPSATNPTMSNRWRTATTHPETANTKMPIRSSTSVAVTATR